MSRQISVEDAFPTFRKRLGELFEENLILRATVDVLERRLAELDQPSAPPAAGEEAQPAPESYLSGDPV